MVKASMRMMLEGLVCGGTDSRGVNLPADQGVGPPEDIYVPDSIVYRVA